MKRLILFILFLYTSSLFAQNFTENTDVPFDGALGSSIAFSDVNGDTYPDVLITGFNNDNDRIAKLYTNDGNGNFTELTDTPFEGVAGTVAFWDINGDTYPDAFLIGRNINDIPVAKMYLNDGAGNFTEALNIPFEGVTGSDIAFADVNGNTYPDILITGENNAGTRTAKLYLNDGVGIFTLDQNTPFVGVVGGSIGFADVNSDTYPDALITGVKGGTFDTDRSTELYINDGNGNFSEVNSTPFEQVGYNSIAFEDVNLDTYPDVLLTGTNDDGTALSILYINNGAGNFSEVNNTPFDGVAFSSVAFTDVNGDAYPDVIIAGKTDSNTRIAKLYINDETGNFSELADVPFDGVYRCSVAFSDVDGDSQPDLLITGQNTEGDAIAKLYNNNGVIDANQNILEETLIDHFTIYPNPASAGTVTISNKHSSGSPLTIQVFDINGRQVLTQLAHTSPTGDEINISTRNLEKGIYFIKINNETNVSLLKVLIQ